MSISPSPLHRQLARLKSRPKSPPLFVSSSEIPVLLAAILLVRGDARIKVQRAKGPADLSLEVLKALSELLFRQPLLTSWTPTLGKMASLAQPQNHGWSFTRGSGRCLLPNANKVFKACTLRRELAPHFLRWMILSGPSALRTRHFRTPGGLSVPIPRLTGGHLERLSDLMEGMHSPVSALK